ncbi:hypothetical protein [Bradyrhizobium sp.]|uniref:hypothetical protein n=1 Tax=Bradyrhizobium sp. TaxID=376 RepID=UPI003C5CB737
MFGFIWHGAFARAVFLAIALVGASAPAMAQNAIWFGNGAPTADEWNQLNNWSTGVLPTGTASFVNNGAPTNLSIRATGAGTDVTLGALQFVGPGYTIDVGDGITFTTLTLTGAGIIASSPNAPTIGVTFGGLNFLNTSTAGSATLNNAGSLVPAPPEAPSSTAMVV